MNLETLKRDTEVSNILKRSGLDFTIEKRRLVDVSDVGNPILDKPTKTPYYGLKNMKSGEYIHAVKKGYVVSQNEDIIRAVLKGIEGFGNLSIAFGGAINGGRKIFIQLRVDGVASIRNDEITKYITIIDSNDGSAAVSVGIGNQVASCMNQYFKFYKHQSHKIRHSKTLEEKMKNLPYLITTAMQEHMILIETYRDFESTRISQDLAHRMVDHILGCSLEMDKSEFNKLSTYKRNQVNKLTGCIKSEMIDKGDNLWGLFNGVTKWTTHNRAVPKRPNGRIESLMLGSAYKENEKAMAFCNDIFLS